MIVVDASVLAPALVDDGDDGDRARARLLGQRLAAPELVDMEVSSMLRRLVVGGQLPARRAELALSDLVALPVRRVSHRPLLARIWGLRHNLSVYDAAYIALAEHLHAVVVTADARLATAPGPRCEVELVGGGPRR